MSKLGKKPIKIPEGVEIKIDNNTINVLGPKGELSFKARPNFDIEIEENLLKVKTTKKDKFTKSLWGMTRSQIENMVIGVQEGYSKTLELIGVGFKAALEGDILVLNVGFSHQVKVEKPQDIDVKIEKNKIIISGINKQKVGQFAAKVRSIKKPEPYKGKGIKYIDEIVRRKAGKVIAKAEGEGGASKE